MTAGEASHEMETALDDSEDRIERILAEADALLDHALKSLAMPGATMGERLKFAAYKYPKISRVWNAHRLRNQLAHEASFYLDPSMAKSAIRDFKDALRLMSVL